MILAVILLHLGLGCALAFQSQQMVVHGASVDSVNGYYYCFDFGDCRNDMYSLSRASRMNGDRLQRVWYLSLLPTARGATLDPSYRFTYASIEMEKNATGKEDISFERWRNQKNVYEEKMQVFVVPLECSEQSERLEVEANVYSLLSSSKMTAAANRNTLQRCVEVLMSTLDGKTQVIDRRGSDLIPRLGRLVQTIDNQEAPNLLALCAWATSIGAVSISGQCYHKVRSMTEYEAYPSLESIRMSALSCYSYSEGGPPRLHDECLRWNGLLHAAVHSLLAEMDPRSTLQITSTYLTAIRSLRQQGREQGDSWILSQCYSLVMGFRTVSTMLLHGVTGNQDGEAHTEHVQSLLRMIQTSADEVAPLGIPITRALTTAGRDILQHAGYLCLGLMGTEGSALEAGQARGLLTSLLYDGSYTVAADLAQAVVLRAALPRGTEDTEDTESDTTSDSLTSVLTELCPRDESVSEEDSGPCELLQGWQPLLRQAGEEGAALLGSPLVRAMIKTIQVTRRLARSEADVLSLTLPLALHLASPTSFTLPTGPLDDLAIHAPSEQELLRALLVLLMDDVLASCRQGLPLCRLEDPVLSMGSRGLFLLAYAGIYTADAQSLESGMAGHGPLLYGEAHQAVMRDDAVPARYQELLRWTQPHWPWHFHHNVTGRGVGGEGRSSDDQGSGDTARRRRRGLLGLLQRWRGKIKAATREDRPPPKIGVMSAYLTTHSVGRLFGPVLAALNGTCMEVHVLSLARELPSSPLATEMKRLVLARGGAWHDVLVERQLSGEVAADVPSVVRAVRALDLDVLVGLDTVMDSLTAHVLCMRLAPSVVLAWGHPFTAGYADTVDYFITGEDYENTNPAVHSRRMHLELLYKGPMHSPTTGELLVPAPAHRWVPSKPHDHTKLDRAQLTPRAPLFLREYRHREQGFSEQLVRFDSLQFLMYPLGEALEGTTVAEARDEDEKEDDGEAFVHMVERGVTVNLAPHSMLHLPPCTRGAPKGQRHRHRVCYRVYACLQSLMKMHPMMDRMWARLLLQDSSAVLLLQADTERHGAWTRSWLARLKATMRQEALEKVRVMRTGAAGAMETETEAETEAEAEAGTARRDTLQRGEGLMEEVESVAVAAEARVVLLPRLPHHKYLQYLCLSDVSVDSAPFGGGVTMTDALRCDQVHGSSTPFVTHPSLQTVHQLGGGIVSALNSSLSAKEGASDAQVDVRGRLWRECCSDGRALCAVSATRDGDSRVLGLSVNAHRYLLSRERDLTNPRGRRMSMSKQRKDRKRVNRRDRALRRGTAATKTSMAAEGEGEGEEEEEGGESRPRQQMSPQAALRRRQDEHIWDYVDLAHCAALASRNESSYRRGARGQGTAEAERLLFASLDLEEDARHAAVQEWQKFLLAVA